MALSEREEALGFLMDSVIEELKLRIKSGEASPQDIKNAIQLLKDNGISCEVKKGSPLAGLKDALPFNDSDTYAPVQ